MPDPDLKRNKTTSKKKRKPSNSNVDKKTNKASLPKKKKPSAEDGIAKSKQLVLKLQTSNTSNRGGPKSCKTNNNEVRLCGNGKPMPSLAELEKMFEDSDSDDQAVAETKPGNKCNPASTSTPITSPKLTEKLISPKTIKKIANKMLDLVSNFTELPVLLDNDGPAPPVTKPKKRKKSGIPYIVGCKDRAYVPSKPNNSVFKGDDKYGVEDNDSEDDDDVPKKRAKCGKGANISKSIFNAVSDEIAARLKENDEANSDGSSDSNKTVAYEYYTPYTNKLRPFSPLPSTSRDNETFVKNDQLFNESLNENIPTPSDDDVEIVQTPCETIVINDTMPITKPVFTNDSEVIDLIDDNSIDNLHDKINIETISKTCYDDIEQIVEVKPAFSIPVDNHYNSYVDLHIEPTCNDDVCEVIDVDDLIAENAAIIKKYSKTSDLNTITSVDISSSSVTIVENETEVISLDEDKSTNVIVNKDIPNTAVTTNVPTPSLNENCCAETNRITNGANDVMKVLENNLHCIQAILNVMPNTRNLLETALNNLNKKHMPEIAQRSNTVYSNLRKDLIQSSPQKNRTSPLISTDSPEAGSKNLGDCPICMETLSNKTVASTMCGHIFCMSCIKQSIKSNGKKCPTCRKTLRGAGFHQIFL